MKTIRHAVFETNSSSSHSISISNKNKYTPDDRLKPENGRIYIPTGDFGWEIEKYTDPLSKASYCLTDAFNDHTKEMLRNVIMKGTGATEVEFPETNEGYVDHQSQGTSREALESEEDLFDFLFNPKSFVQTDNDNH